MKRFLLAILAAGVAAGACAQITPATNLQINLGTRNLQNTQADAFGFNVPAWPVLFKSGSVLELASGSTLKIDSGATVIGAPTTPGGSPNQVQYNNAGGLDGTIGMTWTTAGGLVINFNASPLTAGLSGTILQLGQANGTNTRFTLDGIGAAAIIDGRRGKAALTSGSTMLRVGGVPYGATAYANGERAFIDFQTAENQTDTAQGANVVIYATPIGSTSAQSVATFATAGITYTSVFAVNQATLTNPAPYTGTLLHLTSADGANNFTVMDGFAAGPQIIGRRANGTSASPTAILNGQLISSWSGIGYGATGYIGQNSGSVQVVSTQNWTDSAAGTALVFYTTPNSSITPAVALSLGQDKAATFGGSAIFVTHTPSSASDTGVAGTITWDASFVYVCTATNTWKRVAIATW